MYNMPKVTPILLIYSSGQTENENREIFVGLLLASGHQPNVMYDAKSGSNFSKLIFNKNLKKWKIFPTIFSGTKIIASTYFFSLSWKIRNELASAFPEQTRYYILYIVFGDKGGLICKNCNTNIRCLFCVWSTLWSDSKRVFRIHGLVEIRKHFHQQTLRAYFLCWNCVFLTMISIFSSWEFHSNTVNIYFLCRQGSHCLTSIWLRRRPHR